MKKFGFGLLAAAMLAAATLLTSLPAQARSGGGTIWIPPMDGSIGGGGMRDGLGDMGGAWHGGGWQGGPGHGWNGRPPYNGRWNNGRWNGGWNPNWYRNGRWYGPRYAYRYSGYNYFYGGFWYPWPWWSTGWNPAAGDNYGYYGGYSGGGARARHVAWCQGRYRSYNVRTNTYMGYDGRKHRCNSPYD
ncbi:MAG: BA14K family protein [Aestuariivirga sp.]|uniref:BA14K family protein n=1 Tax=Aestuariivirga sp. TaxID=2650926 RepID=UPI0025BB11CC|nr:BA14K family protein [Aestuariivirga sp.]MCA3559836.1 BA14K family protein [Aestuariivirga sp.]